MVPSQPTDKWSYHCRGDAVDGTLFDIKTGRPVWVLSPIKGCSPEPAKFPDKNCSLTTGFPAYQNISNYAENASSFSFLVLI